MSEFGIPPMDFSFEPVMTPSQLALDQRADQLELLSRLVERQDAMIEEQERQAEEQRAAARGSKMREIAVIVLTALSILVTVTLAAAPAVVSTLAR